MAKLITAPIKVTIEHGGTTQTYAAGHGSLSGDGSGLIDIHIRNAHRTNLITNPKEAQVNPSRTTGPTYWEAPECPQKKALIEAAKAQERATLRAARLIEQAQERAEAVINDADHTLNMAIQEYIHTGKNTTDVARVLDGAGIYYNEVRGDQVRALAVDDLYLLDATELLTVG